MRALRIENCEIIGINIANKLEAFQNAVEGYIEVVTLVPEKAVMIVNEEGRLHRMSPNLYASAIAGMSIVGPALIVGVAGEEFTDIPVEIERQILIKYP